MACSETALLFFLHLALNLHLPLGRPRREWEDNISSNIIMKQDVEVLTGYRVPQDRIQWQISINVKMNLVFHMGGILTDYWSSKKLYYI
jgi:hypothetical protein